MPWLIYGAYGYTGRLVTELAVQRGERPVLAGRDPDRLLPLARRLDLPHRVVGLDDPEALAAVLADVSAVAHCAGPFSATSAPLVEACLASGTHYCDITGEIDVIEAVLARNDAAAAAGIALLPGSGFDVVPSDCLAALLAEAMPEAAELALAIGTAGGVSPGTARTALEGLGSARRGRVEGRITEVPAERLHRTVRFADSAEPVEVTAISWGDVASAFHSTGIGTITVYAALPPAAGRVLEVLGPRAGRRDRPPALLSHLVGALPGPSPRTRQRSRGQLWGCVTDAGGAHRIEATMTTPNGYDLTADAVVRIVGRLTSGAVPPGAHTPSGAHGASFAETLDGVIRRGPGPVPAT